MRNHSCQRYCKYGVTVLVGYLIMQAFVWLNTELDASPEESDVIIRGSEQEHRAEKRGGGGGGGRDSEAFSFQKPGQGQGSNNERSQSNKDLRAKEDREAKEEALRIEHQLREEEERRFKVELKQQQQRLHEEEEKRKKLEREEERRRLEEEKKEKELREELSRLQKEIEEKNREDMGIPHKEGPHHPSQDHHEDNHYKYLYVSGKGEDASALHGRHFAMRASQIEHEMEEQVEKHLEEVPGRNFPTIVTAVTRSTFRDVEKLIDSVQYFLPERKMVIFHIDLNDNEVKQLSSACNVEMRLFWMWMFPSHVYNASDMSWKPVIIQMALAEFGSVMWINPTARLVSSNFESLLAEAEQTGFLVLSTRKQYSTFSVTHPSMYSYIPTDMTKIMESNHLSMRLLIIHNTHEIQENLFKWLILCSLERECLAPAGSRTQCDFPLKKDTYANCHQYEESAFNILVKNYFSYRLESFNYDDYYTMNSADWKGRINIKQCQ